MELQTGAKIDEKTCRLLRWPHEAIRAGGVGDVFELHHAGSCEASVRQGITRLALSFSY